MATGKRGPAPKIQQHLERPNTAIGGITPRHEAGKGPVLGTPISVSNNACCYVDCKSKDRHIEEKTDNGLSQCDPPHSLGHDVHITRLRRSSNRE